MKEVYPELAQVVKDYLKVVELEESRFRETLNTGLNMLDNLISSCWQPGQE
jgi:alanyl-tRNA synthetase